MTIEGREVDFTLRRRRGTKCLRLSAYPDGYVVVSAPARYPIFLINLWLRRNTQWISRRITEMTATFKDDRGEYESRKKEIKIWLGRRIEEINCSYGFRYERISVRRVRTRWGSCSARKNLNFNYKLYYLEKELQDYVIVHEICHLEELNHSSKFWALVARTVPDFRQRRKRLYKIKI